MELNTNNRSLLGETLALAGIGILGGLVSVGINALVEEARARGAKRYHDRLVSGELDEEIVAKTRKKTAKKKAVKKVVTKQVVAKKVARKTANKK